MSTDDLTPPVPKYKLTVEITGNSHKEIAQKLEDLGDMCYLRDSDYYRRDEFYCIGGTTSRRLEHTNPEMTAERYDKELEEWYEAGKRADDEHW